MPNRQVPPTPVPERPVARLPVVKQAVEVQVTLPWSADNGTVAGWIWAPAQPDSGGVDPRIFCCLPGGSCSTGYFDLQVGGLSDYSMAEWLASRGSIVISLDHPGVGGSSRVPNIYALTPRVVGDVNHQAYSQVLDGLAAGTAIFDYPPVQARSTIGCGHSMGGMLAAVQQARHRTFDSLVIMGTGNGLPTVLTDAELAYIGAGDAIHEALPELARARFSPDVPRAAGGAAPPGMFHAGDVPDVVRQAFVQQLTGLLFSCGLASMIPLTTAAERASIDVPILLVFGDDDLEQHPHSCVPAYVGSPDVTLQVIAECGHCHNQSGRRAEVWNRLLTWASMAGA